MPKRRWEDIITMDPKEIGINTKNWLDSAQISNYWRAVVNAVLNLCVPYPRIYAIYIYRYYNLIMQQHPFRVHILSIPNFPSGSPENYNFCRFQHKLLLRSKQSCFTPLSIMDEILVSHYVTFFIPIPQFPKFSLLVSGQDRPWKHILYFINSAKW